MGWGGGLPWGGCGCLRRGRNSRNGRRCTRGVPCRPRGATCQIRHLSLLPSHSRRLPTPSQCILHQLRCTSRHSTRRSICRSRRGSFPSWPHSYCRCDCRTGGNRWGRSACGALGTGPCALRTAALRGARKVFRRLLQQWVSPSPWIGRQVSHSLCLHSLRIRGVPLTLIPARIIHHQGSRQIHPLLIHSIA